MYSKDEAKQAAATYPGSRIEERKDGSYRAVFDHAACVGRKGSDKKRLLGRKLLASWGGVQIDADLWAALPDLSDDQADRLRAQVEPHLPIRWRFPEQWCIDGRVYLMTQGKKTLVTSHV